MNKIIVLQLFISTHCTLINTKSTVSLILWCACATNALVIFINGIIVINQIALSTMFVCILKMFKFNQALYTSKINHFHYSKRQIWVQSLLTSELLLYSGIHYAFYIQITFICLVGVYSIYLLIISLQDGIELFVWHNMHYEIG